MPSMTMIALDLTYHSMEYEPKHILTGVYDPMWLGEIQKFPSPLLPVSKVLSVISVDMNQPGCQI